MKKIKQFIKNTIKFRKPFAELVEGAESNQIIGWYKIGCFRDKEGFTVQWKYFLHIDLWIMKLRFTWIYPIKIK